MQSSLAGALSFSLLLLFACGDEDAAPEVRAVGSACVIDEQCDTPADALCLATIGGGSIPQVALPGGYCSKYCQEAEECGSGDPACFTMGTKGSGISVCVATCFAPEDCRKDEGYTCMILLPGLPGFCVPG